MGSASGIASISYRFWKRFFLFSESIKWNVDWICQQSVKAFVKIYINSKSDKSTIKLLVNFTIPQIFRNRNRKKKAVN